MARVLVVEDSPTQAQALAIVLEEAGHEVVTVGSAERGFGSSWRSNPSMWC